MCENWLNLINSLVYYACHTHEIYQLVPHLVDFKAPRRFEIHCVKKYLVNVVLFLIKDLWTYEMTAQK